MTTNLDELSMMLGEINAGIRQALKWQNEHEQNDVVRFHDLATKIDTTKDEVTKRVEVVKAEVTSKVDVIKDEVTNKIDRAKNELSAKLDPLKDKVATAKTFAVIALIVAGGAASGGLAHTLGLLGDVIKFF